MAAVLRNSYLNFSKYFFLNLPKATTTAALRLLESRLCWINNGICIRNVHLTRNIYGIEEFFPPRVMESDEPMPEEIASGRSWRAGELRQKSNEDLHKLWYVLLKERNMLMTVQWEARRQEVLMPSPERLQKIKKSMAMIKLVIGERTKAIEDIETRYKEKQVDSNLIKEDIEGHKEIIEGSQELEERSRQVPLAT